MYGSAYVCMYVWMDEWMDGWMDGCVYAWMYVCMHGCMDGLMYVCMGVHAFVCMCFTPLGASYYVWSGSAKANRREPKTGLGRVFNYKLGCYDDAHVIMFTDAHPYL